MGPAARLRVFDGLSWVLVALVPLLVYAPTLRYGFVFDDAPLIVTNSALRDPGRLTEYFTRDIDALWRSSEEVQSNYYRPLLYVVLAALRRACLADPARWHAAVVGLHAVAALLAAALLRSRGHGPAAALLGSLLFSLHPSHVDSVAWVSGIQDVLLGVTGLLGYLAWRGFLRRGGVPRLVTLAVSYAAALLSKEAAVGLLLVATAEWALEQSHLPRTDAGPPRARLGVALLAALTLLYLGLRFAVLGALARPFPTAPRLPLVLATVPVVIVVYLKDLLWPVGLSLLSPVRPVASVAAPAVLVSLVGLLLLLLAFRSWIRGHPWALAPGLWLGAWLAPCLNLWAVNPEWIVMDRYLFLPALALGWWLVGPSGAGWPSPPRVVCLVLVAGAFAGISLVHMRAYVDEESFWASAVRSDPGSSTAWTEVGRLHLDRGRVTDARAALDRAVALDPASLLPRLRLGILAYREGRAADAIGIFRSLVASSPGYAPAWRNLPVALDAAGRHDEALQAARLAAARFPRDVEVLGNLGVLLRSQGRGEEALETLRAARRVAPRDARLALREALLLAELGRREESLGVASEALSLGLDPAQRAQIEALRRQMGSGP